MVCSQFFGILASSNTTITNVTMGQNPELGPYATGRTNDVPYSDRALACIYQKGSYEPVLLTDLLGSTSTSVVVGTTGASVDGYRVVQRTGATLDSATAKVYSDSCKLIETTLDNILGVCSTLGYGVVRDGLRIVGGVNSNKTQLILNSLPVLIIPYWDNSLSARYVIPGRDGSACLIHLVGQFEGMKGSGATIRGINRTIREAKTAEWLHQPGGRWRNGWYEDNNGGKWYADMMSTNPSGTWLPTRDRYFDAKSGTEIDCSLSTACQDSTSFSAWGPKFKTEIKAENSTGIVIYNGTQFGIFWFEAVAATIVRSVYDWATVVSNATIALLIFRWMVALLALSRGYLDGRCSLHHSGIGALSNASSFQSLPILLLPRLSLIICAFFSIGCRFQGQQSAFTETWFVMYPAITEFVLIYYSLLNALAKFSRRRITDALFAPTIITLAGLHFFRVEIATWQWMGIADRFVQTLVMSDELSVLTLDKFFTTDVALRLNGGVTVLFALKLGVLALSLLPLLLTRPLPARRNIAATLSGIEKALGVRAGNVAGLGRSEIYQLPNGSPFSLIRTLECVHPYDYKGSLVLNSYELVRLGCVVYGDRYLITMDDWDRISMLTGVRHFYHLWNHRVVMFDIRPSKRLEGYLEVAEHPHLLRVDAPELQKISVWQISACSLGC